MFPNASLYTRLYGPLFLVVFLLIYILQIREEERKLSERFGDVYQDYSRRVPKYFPNIFSLFKKCPKNCLSFKWEWARKELPSLCWAAVILIAVEAWADAQLFGRAACLKEFIELALIAAFFVGIFWLFFKSKDQG